MFKNYFKTAWRYLLRNRFYSIINISGLTVGIAVGILILIWVQDEFGFDTFHKNTSNIYKLENIVGTGPSRQIWENTTAPIGMFAKKKLPGVQDFARIYSVSNMTITYQDKKFDEKNLAFADPALFKIFDIDFIKGNAASPFPDDNSVVLTETNAKKYFGNDNPIGKVIQTSSKKNLTVTGIIKDMPKNTALTYELLAPMTFWEKEMYANDTTGTNLNNDFHQFAYRTYLLFQPAVSLTGFTDKLRTIHLRNKPDDVDIEYALLPLSKAHLYRSDGTDGGIETVRMFMLIALVILVIACINYVNLSTARSMLRSKEVSLRKIAGAGKFQLFMQFIAETALVFMLASLMALLVIYLLMPMFNHLSGKSMSLDLTSRHIWKIILLTITGTLIISSIYPALLLSSFEPIKALKGRMAARFSDKLFRKVLVVTQFVFSIVLISGTFIIFKQLNYVRSKKLGYEKENVFFFNIGAMQNHLEEARTALLQEPGVAAVSWASENIMNIGSQTGNNEWEGKEPGETMMLSPMAVDKDFISFFNMEMAEGKGFTGSASDSMHFILNETAIKAARIKDPIGKKFKLWNTEGTIIGVMKDFHFASMKEKIKPAIFLYNPHQYGKMYVKTTGKDAKKAIVAAEKKFNQYNAGYPFSYSFVDETFNTLYESEQRTSTLFNIFAGIAIFISCLGLMGLAAYTAQTRIREIGVRKVLGASVAGIIQMLAGDFIKLVVLAIIIAVPIAWYIMNKWLQGFAYKTDIGWLVFAASGITAIVIAAITISFQAVKAAVANPVKSLRTE